MQTLTCAGRPPEAYLWSLPADKQKMFFHTHVIYFILLCISIQSWLLKVDTDCLQMKKLKQITNNLSPWGKSETTTVIEQSGKTS